MTHSLGLLISDEGVCRTAPATRGLLIRKLTTTNNLHLFPDKDGLDG